MGAVASAALPWAEPAGDPLEQPGLLSYWAHWDGAWYTEIAAAGYIARAPESTAFFPVFPMIMRVGSVLGGGPALWGVLVSLVATAFALYFLYRIAEKFRGKNVARATTFAFAFFPTAFYLNARLRRRSSSPSAPVRSGRPMFGGTSCSRVSWEPWPPVPATQGCSCLFLSVTSGCATGRSSVGEVPGSCPSCQWDSRDT